LLFYAEDENQLIEYMDSFMKDRLKDLDYEQHEKEYCNNGQFIKVKDEY